MYGLYDPSTQLQGLTPESNIFTNMVLMMQMLALPCLQTLGSQDKPQQHKITNLVFWTRTHTQITHKDTYRHIHAYNCMHAHIHLCAYTKTHTNYYTHVCTNTYAFMQAHNHLCVHAHRRVHPLHTHTVSH